MTPPPEIKVEGGRVINWEEIRGWMMRSDPLTYNAIAYSDKMGCTEEDALRMVAYHSAVQRCTKQIDYSWINAAVDDLEKNWGGTGWPNSLKQMIVGIIQRRAP